MWTEYRRPYWLWQVCGILDICDTAIAGALLAAPGGHFVAGEEKQRLAIL
jgi:hypothetical protein